ncbi:MAG: hypothetical protein DWQ01_01780 [Planctomycetota bacterium]|nr:MAG: hypothetical protein DWQ01_01780 [Planctomycetota bacterium]
MHKEPILEDGNWGPRLLMRGTWTPSLGEQIDLASVRELIVDWNRGWRGRDLWFLQEFPDLEALRLRIPSLEDPSVLYTLEKLRSLHLATFCNSEIHFEKWPHLQECRLDWMPCAASILQQGELQALRVDHFPGRDLSSMTSLRKLQRLQFHQPRLRSLAGAGVFAELEHLKILDGHRLRSLDGLQSLTRLQRLDINRCPRLKDLQALAELTSLQVLHLTDNGKIPSLQPLATLRELRELRFYDSTEVVDGDLRPLLALTKLEKLAFKPRDHYTHGWADFPQIGFQ